MKLGVYVAGYDKPQFLADTLDACLEWIGNQIGTNWATKLEAIAWEDGSYTVHAIRTDELLDFTIGPVYQLTIPHNG